VRRIRARWTTTRILLRADGHYARPEAMTWCEDNTVGYVFGLSGAKPLSRKVDETADAVRTDRAVLDLDVVRGFAETRYAGRLLGQGAARRPRIDAIWLGLDIRFVVTNLDHGLAEWPYKTLYCARGQAENLIKLHRPSSPQIVRPAGQPGPTRFASSSTSPPSGRCSLCATPFPSRATSAKAEFATLRLKLIRIARVVEMASRVRLAFAAACPNAVPFASLPAALMPRGPRTTWPAPLLQPHSQAPGPQPACG
jgi:hypothetical protein